MSFVFSSLGCRLAAAAISALMLSGCSGSDRVPFADVGGPRAGDQLIGKVDRTRDGRVLIGRVGEVSPETAAYAAPAGAQNAGSEGLDYLNTPNLAETDASETAPMMAAEPAAMDAGQGGAMSAMVIPEGGVNIDGQLGIGAEAGVSDADYADGASPVGVQPHVVTSGGAMAIAEGNTSQPVVDGIGFDEPTQIVTGPSGASPAGEEMQVAQDMPDEGGILPLSADNGNSGMEDPAPVASRRVAASSSQAPAGKDCSLYLDKRNCR